MGISPLGDNFAPSSDVSSSQETRSAQVEQAQQVQLERQERGRETGAGGDSVSLSSLGAELARSLSTESALEVRQVDELQKAVNNGTFAASSEETAARIVDDALHSQPAQARPGVEGPPSPV
jgi:anti-sigma28 factor (negative regulator of flagellin synthesis)